MIVEQYGGQHGVGMGKSGAEGQIVGKLLDKDCALYESIEIYKFLREAHVFLDQFESIPHSFLSIHTLKAFFHYVEGHGCRETGHHDGRGHHQRSP